MDGDAEGHADDPSILGEWRFLRRIHPDWIKGFRPESSNFEARGGDEGLSVTAWTCPADLETVIAEGRNFGIVVITAAQLRDAGYRIVRVPFEGNPNHCECFGKVTRGGRKQLAREATWVLAPPGHIIADDGSLTTP